MTDSDLKHFYEKLEGYFPNALTVTQLEAWTGRIRCLELSEALSALSDYYCSTKLPGDGKVPSFNGFRRHLRQRKEEHRERGWQHGYSDEHHYQGLEAGSLREILTYEAAGPEYANLAQRAYDIWRFARTMLDKPILDYRELIAEATTL